MVVSFLAANGTQAAPASLLPSSIKEGMLVYDDSANVLKVCDGANWVSLIDSGSAGTFSQWANGTSGAIYYNGGNVGIGTSTPGTALHIANSAGSARMSLTPVETANALIDMQSKGTDGLVSSAGNKGWRLNVRGDAHSNVPMRNAFSFDYYDNVAGVNFFTILPTGNVGIGATTPASRLHVAGGIQLGDDTAACPGGSNEKLGTMRFNTGALQLCTMSGWGAVSSGSANGPCVAGGPDITQPSFAHYANWTNNLSSSTSDMTQISNDAYPNFGWHHSPSSVSAGSPDYAAIDYVTPVRVCSLAFKVHTNPFQNFTFQGSNDSTNGMDGTWTDIYSGAVVDRTEGNISSYNFNNPSSYRWYRVKATTQFLGGWAMYQWKMYAHQTSTTPAAGSNGYVQFNASNAFSADANLVWDNSNKRLGIGVGSPQEQLELFKNGGGAVLRFHSPGVSEYKVGVPVGQSSLRFMNTNGNTALQTETRGLTIDTSGNVGIGTTSPGAKLDVNGHTRTASLSIQGGGTYEAGSIFSDVNWGMLFRAKQAAPNSGEFSFAKSDDTKLLTIVSSGNVGIGTTSPTRNLDVGGTSAAHVKIGGRGAFALAAEAVCMGSGIGGKFLMWSVGTSQTCAQACATIVCGAAASCVKGWTMWAGETHYEYGTECSSLDPSGGQSISGKYCCCNSSCAQPLYMN